MGLYPVDDQANRSWVVWWQPLTLVSPLFAPDQALLELWLLLLALSCLLVECLPWLSSCTNVRVSDIYVRSSHLQLTLVVGARVTLTNSALPYSICFTSDGNAGVGAGFIGWIAGSFGIDDNIFEMRNSSARSFSSGKLASFISTHFTWEGLLVVACNWFKLLWNYSNAIK